MRINISAKYLKYSLEKITGLAGKREIYPVFFTTRFGIHTFGMLKNIDVIIMDSKNRVVDLRKNLKPNRLFFWNPIHSRVLELPANRYNIKSGDLIVTKLS